MLLVFLVALAVVFVIVADRLLPLPLPMTMISKIPRFVFYLPLLVVGVMTHSYVFGPTIEKSCNIYYFGVISYLHTTFFNH